MILHFLAANPYSIKATDIGLPTSTANLGVGLTNITRTVMTLVGMLSVIFMIVGGLQLGLSAGNSKRVAQGRETILYAAVGLAVAIASYAIVTFVSGSINR